MRPGTLTLGIDTGHEVLNYYIYLAAKGVASIRDAIDSASEAVESLARKVRKLSPWKRAIQDRLDLVNDMSFKAMTASVTVVEVLCGGSTSGGDWLDNFERVIEGYAKRVLEAGDSMERDLAPNEADAEIHEAVSGLLQGVAHRAYAKVKEAAEMARREACPHNRRRHGTARLPKPGRQPFVLDRHLLARRRRVVASAAAVGSRRSIQISGGLVASATVALSVTGRLSEALTKPLSVFDMAIPGASISIPKVRPSLSARAYC